MPGSVTELTEERRAGGREVLQACPLSLPLPPSPDILKSYSPHFRSSFLSAEDISGINTGSCLVVTLYDFLLTSQNFTTDDTPPQFSS